MRLTILEHNVCDGGLTMTHAQSSGAPAPERAENERLEKWLGAAAALAVGGAFFALWFWLLTGTPSLLSKASLPVCSDFVTKSRLFWLVLCRVVRFCPKITTVLLGKPTVRRFTVQHFGRLRHPKRQQFLSDGARKVCRKARKENHEKLSNQRNQVHSDFRKQGRVAHVCTLVRAVAVDRSGSVDRSLWLCPGNGKEPRGDNHFAPGVGEGAGRERRQQVQNA